MIKSSVIGASGYTGAELCRLLHSHPAFSMEATYVSANSKDAYKKLSDIHPALHGILDHTLTPLLPESLSQLADSQDVIFLATPHEASHDWMPELADRKAVVIDLSGAFRIQDIQVFASAYGFEHMHHDYLKKAVYGLAEWHTEDIKNADIIAVPGCYPTASLTALKPISHLLDTSLRPIINAVSGVSGAGRKAALINSYCEVSLQAYGVLSHRHQPEIAAYLGEEVIFTPHLGNFKRGILATVTVKTQPGTTTEQVTKAYQQAYADSPIVRLLAQFPRIDDVVHTPFCDLYWKLEEHSGYLVIGSAIDNLLKGAASQAVQCANLRFGLETQTGLIGSRFS